MGAALGGLDSGPAAVAAAHCAAAVPPPPEETAATSASPSRPWGEGRTRRAAGPGRDAAGSGGGRSCGEAEGAALLQGSPRAAAPGSTRGCTSWQRCALVSSLPAACLMAAAFGSWRRGRPGLWSLEAVSGTAVPQPALTKEALSLNEDLTVRAIRVEVFGPGHAAHEGAAKPAAKAKLRGAGWSAAERTAAWPPTPDPWLLHYGSTSAPSSQEQKRQVTARTSDLVWVALLATAVALSIALMALAVALWRWWDSRLYVQIPTGMVDVLRSGIEGKQARRPEDLFFRAADLADRILAGTGEASLQFEELEQLREEVAACPSHGDADHQRLALASQALDIAGRARSTSVWWMPKALLVSELKGLRQQCIHLGIFDNRIMPGNSPRGTPFPSRSWPSRSWPGS